MKRTRRSAFTLAEMLVVITIIVILASLLVPAVYLGLVAARNAAIVVELGQLDSAMKQYKVLYKNYPPNFGDAAKVKAHIQQAFGRYNGTPPAGLDPGEALVFWLQGYSDNPIDPLGGTRKSLMQFNETRLLLTRTVNGVNLYHYYPADGQKVPYVYFHNTNYGANFTPTAATYTPYQTAGAGVARPYKSSAAGNPFINPETFQIISAGLDGDYGAGGSNFPDGPHASGDKDNITNFSGGTLQSKVK